MTLASFFCNSQAHAFNSDGRVHIGYTHVFPLSRTFTIQVPGKYRVVAIGGGGGCHAFSISGILTAGGAAGGMAVATRDFAAGDTLTIAIGAGGSGNLTAPPSGGTITAPSGSATTVSGPGLSLIAGGGNGGIAIAPDAPVGIYPGAIGGSASGGDFNYTGGSSGYLVKVSPITTNTGIAGPGAIANPFLVANGGAGFSGGWATVSSLGGPASVTADGHSNTNLAPNQLVAHNFESGTSLYYDYAGCAGGNVNTRRFAETSQLPTALGEGLASYSELQLADYAGYNFVGRQRIAGQPFHAQNGSTLIILNNYGAGGFNYTPVLGSTIEGGGQGVVFLTYLEG